MSVNKTEVLAKIFSPGQISLNLKAIEKDEAFEELVQGLIAQHKLQDGEMALAALRERESKMSTGISGGVAIPHCKMEHIDHIIGSLGISKAGIDYDALDKKPVHLVFLLISPLNDPQTHLEVLRRLARLIEQTDFYNQVQRLTSAKEINSLLAGYESSLH